MSIDTYINQVCIVFRISNRSETHRLIMDLQSSIWVVTDLNIDDYPPELATLIERVNENVRAARLCYEGLKNSSAYFRDPSIQVLERACAIQALLRTSAKEFIQTLINRCGELDNTVVRLQHLVEEYEGTLESFLPTHTDIPRPMTSASDLAVREAEWNQIALISIVGAQSPLSKPTDAILKLPLRWLLSQFEDHYPPQFRQVELRNPSGCWFRSLDDRHRLSPVSLIVLLSPYCV